MGLPIGSWSRKYDGECVASFLFHDYPSARLALFAYVVVANTPGTPLNGLADLEQRGLSHAPRVGENSVATSGSCSKWKKRERKRTAVSKMSVFRESGFCTLAEMQGFPLRAFDSDYKQPRISLEDPSSVERPLLLLSARIRTITGEAHRCELQDILRFVCTKSAPEGLLAGCGREPFLSGILRRASGKGARLRCLPPFVHSVRRNLRRSWVGR